MTFGEALQRLNIEDYSKRIFHSNSHGELFHCIDYIVIAETKGDMSWFRVWFEAIVEWTGKNWKRPESVFQHIPKFLMQTIDEIKAEREDNKA